MAEHAQSAGDFSGGAYRLQEEARELLRMGFTTAEAVDPLIERAKVERGERGAERLRAAMREQWRTRRAWWPGAPA